MTFRLISGGTQGVWNAANRLGEVLVALRSDINPDGGGDQGRDPRGHKLN